MKDIRIKPRTQGLAVVGMLAAIGAAMAAQAPEIRRYLKLRSM